MVIRKREEYVVNGLGKVTKLSAFDAEECKKAGEPEILWEGFAILGVPTSNKDQIAQVPVEFVFEKNYATVQEAFNDFQAEAIKEFKKQMAYAEQREKDSLLKSQTKILGPEDLGWKPPQLRR